ncbi:PTS sugar transporter subunit IIA [Pantoea sp. 1.19]|uniref:PTS sugar transporter subunit IIA n=1 Tax=Pantoea sp. 1.19 TaxID=1925589 RepID=UPI000948F812|nr:PTS sugar transporter subunit IIA [Pantoea sp. 1.19]
MLTDWLNDQTINVVDRVEDWQQAIRLSAAPLLAAGAIAPAYITAMIDSHLALGPYSVLAPGLALPHARPEQGALANGLSLLHVRTGVPFGSAENDPVRVVMTLCAPSGNHHIALIAELADVLSDETRLAALLSATTPAAIRAVIAPTSPLEREPS